MFHKNDNSIIISNVLGRNYDCIEVPATHIQILDLNTNRLTLCPWNEEFCLCKEIFMEEWLRQLRIQQSLPDDEFHIDFVEDNYTEEVIVNT